ncbi:hypothetical protein UFOVP28_15 [uncultured Caudovirales phage]|uniref:Uncharacterized protein n=1 Tax=uncultured Caudovirales phage TaxID=2100421 RepID=A0A6J5KK46_9CAUD|nr:hypothetical protein UFOVP28_15 [uncultured Caudovirales phage]
MSFTPSPNMTAAVNLTAVALSLAAEKNPLWDKPAKAALILSISALQITDNPVGVRWRWKAKPEAWVYPPELPPEDGGSDIVVEKLYSAEPDWRSRHAAD